MVFSIRFRNHVTDDQRKRHRQHGSAESGGWNSVEIYNRRLEQALHMGEFGCLRGLGCALKALIVANEYLESEVCEFCQACP